MADNNSFSYNIAFTLAVNDAKAETLLTPKELWQGIKRGGRNPNDFAPYVDRCEVLSGGHKQFRRKLILADGAVHTAAGESLVQDVLIADMLHVEATTIASGAKSTFLFSYDAADGKDEKDLYLTAMYELKMDGMEPGSPAAMKIETDYRQLAKGACASAVSSIRLWKEQGLLAKWAKEDETLEG
ncbi:Pumilio-like 3 [Apiospora arundinis]